MERSQASSTRRNWRSIAFIVAALVGAALTLGLFGSVFAIMSPWLANPDSGPPPGYADPKSHRWHDALWGAQMGILLGVGYLTLLRRPERKPVIVQMIVLTSLVTAVVAAVFGDPGLMIALVPAAAIAALYPNRSALMQVPNVQHMHLLLAALAVIFAFVVAPDAWDRVQLQRADASGDEHAEFGHWIGTAYMLLNFTIAGLLAATRAAGWRTLTALAGFAMLYLGIAALTTREYLPSIEPPGTWSALVAVIALICGVGFLAVAFADERVASIAPWLAKSNPEAAT